MAYRTDHIRAALLAAAEAQLVTASDGEISTRAVCDAVGVSQPVLYRVFGDKRGLLDALADQGLRRYETQKSTLDVTADPVADLQAGWDDHLAFADANPALYKLMFSPRPWADTSAREGVMRLLIATLIRCASTGALRLEPVTAAKMVLSANVGLALNRIAQPGEFATAALSTNLRDAVFSHILTTPAARTEIGSMAAAAIRLQSQLSESSNGHLSAEETALLNVWLAHLSQTPNP